MILKYELFDLDDNLLYLNTTIDILLLENNEWIKKTYTTSEFSKIRNQNNWKVLENDLSFINFSDNGKNGDDTLLIDVKDAIKNKHFAPAWTMFINSLVSGHIIGIITARSHKSINIRNIVKFIINNFLNAQQRKLMLNNLNYFRGMFKKERNIDLIEKYLDSCYFVGISSKEFIEENNINTVEDNKKIAIKKFTNKVNYYANLLNTNFEIHFSDDDKLTTDTVEKCMKNELSLDFLNCDFYIMNTNSNNKEIKI